MKNNIEVFISEDDIVRLVGHAFLFNSKKDRTFLKDLRKEENYGYNMNCDGDYLVPKKWVEDFNENILAWRICNKESSGVIDSDDEYFKNRSNPIKYHEAKN